jgi:ubiquinone/menaquinone biosynthesis C-methylase UbiE
MPKARESGMPDPASWETFFNPTCIVSKLDCRGGDVVEFGCGYGLFTVPAAWSVSGTVFALDIDPQMVAATAQRAAEAGQNNVAAELRDFIADGCGRPDESAAHTMLYNILHVEEPDRLLREAFRVLTPGGTVGIIHWKSDPATPRGPSLAIRPTPAQCRGWAEAAGFRFIREEDLCCCSWHWGLMMERPIA